jgi:hypothetical protein
VRGFFYGHHAIGEGLTLSEVIYDVEKLKRLWARGLTHLKIAEALGCDMRYVAQLRERHNLPMRRRAYHAPKYRDPTPEEIVERAREIRERHYEEKRRQL